MIELDNKLYLDHIDDLLLSYIRQHPDARQADVMHNCPLSGPSTYQRLVRLCHAGFLNASHEAAHSVTYRVAPATKNLKKEDKAGTLSKQVENNNAGSIS